MIKNMTKAEKKQEQVPEERSIAPIEQKAELTEYRQEQMSVEKMIMSAIKEKVDPGTMERFLAMRKELKAEWAKEQFDLSMAQAQGEFPEIRKTKSVKTKAGIVAYSYAPLESIISQVREILSKYKLSYTIKTETKAGDGQTMVKSTVIVKHIAGHSEMSEMEVPLGNKTDIMSQSQVVAAAATFSKRYAFINAFGIMTADADNEEQLKDATPGQIEAAIMLLDKCMTMDSLKKVWSNFSKEIKANKEVIRHANEIKANIENENLQGTGSAK